MKNTKIILLLTTFLVLTFISACGATSEQDDTKNDNQDKVADEKLNSNSNDCKENNEKDSNDQNNEDTTKNEDNTTTNEEQEETTQETVPVREYSEEKQEEASQAFLDWAIPRAEEGGMAVTDNYFGHGASGSGDWYAVTEDGEIQVQEQDPTTESPGYDAFDIHALGGVVFYTSNSGVTGLDEKSYKEQGGAGGGRKYTAVAEPDEPLHKYLLGDNGVVYELIGTAEELNSYQTGFGLYDDDGKTKLFEEEYTFKVSEDQDAQKEWVKILRNFKRIFF